jgi:hypothetical protein
MTTTAPRDVPIPADLTGDDWTVLNEPRPFRLIWGPQRWIGGDAISVRLSAMQYTDGCTSGPLLTRAIPSSPSGHAELVRRPRRWRTLLPTLPRTRRGQN